MALEGRTIVHAGAGIAVAERLDIASRADAAIVTPGAADRFMPVSRPVPSRANSPPQPPPPQRPSRWSTGFFSIHRGICSCIYTCLCPCLVVGRIGTFLVPRTSKYQHCCCFLGLWCCSSYQYRGKIRSKFNLPEVPCNDLCAHALCMCCAICQENRELTRRGADLRWFYPKNHCGSPTCRANHAPLPMVMTK